MSLYRRIMALTVGMTLIVVLAFAVPLAVLARDVVRSDAVDQAIANAVALADYLSTASFDEDDLTEYLARVAERSSGSVAVQLADGTVVGSAPAGAFPAADTPRRRRRRRRTRRPAPRVQAGWARSPRRRPPTSTAESSSTSTAMTASGPADVRVYLTSDQLNDGILWWWALIAAIGAVLLGLAVLGSRMVARRFVKPLASTAGTARRLAAGDQTARAPLDGPPEVATVAAALNQLAERIGDLLAAERETVADLSHRLRTPLTALRLDVESLPDSPAASELADDVSTLERTLTAVIRAARRPEREGFLASCDATAVVAARIAFWTPLAEDQGRRVRLQAPGRPGRRPVLVRRPRLRRGRARRERALAHARRDGLRRVARGVARGPDR